MHATGNSVRWLGLGLLTVSMGCAGGNSPLAPTTAVGIAPGPIPGATVSQGPGAVLMAPAIYRWTLDPESLTASSTLLATQRSGQDNDARYALPIDTFLTSESLHIDKISRDADAVIIDYTFAHPFASSAVSHRADLGITGFLLFLADVQDVAANSYFDEFSREITANTDLVLNADAYWSPFDLLQLTGYNANTFPYKLLVDDNGIGNRRKLHPLVGVFNGGSPTGNYDPTTGWQNAVGASDNWTGYDVLHQGLAAVNQLRLDRRVIESSGPITIDAAVIAKYVDPKSGTPGNIHRLPSDPPDVLGGFAYRYPYGCLDVSKIEYLGQDTHFLARGPSVVNLSFHVRDWDARAMTTTLPLADEPIASKVPTGEVGFPAIAISIPSLEGPHHGLFLTSVPIDDDRAFGGDPDVDSGMAGDPLYLTGQVARDGLPTDHRGSYRALIRAWDSSFFDAPTSFLGGDLLPITGLASYNVTYQRADLHFDDPIGAGFGQSAQGDGLEQIRDLVVDSDGKTWAAGIYDAPIDFGGGVRPNSGDFDCFVVQYDQFGNYVWDRTWGSAGFDDIGGIAVRPDNLGCLTISNFSEDLTYNGFTYVAANWDIALLRFDANGATSSTTIITSPGLDYAGGLVSSGVDNGYFLTGALGGATSVGGMPTGASAGDGFVARVNQFTTASWVTLMHPTGGVVVPSDLTVLPSGGVVTVGAFGNPTDFGGGLRTPVGSADIFVVRHDGMSGAHVWDRTYGGAGEDNAQAVTGGFGGMIALTGYLYDNIDFGGGVRQVPHFNQTGFVLSLTASGTYRWDRVITLAPAVAGVVTGSTLSGVAVLPGSGGDVIVSGHAQDDSWLAGRFLDVSQRNGLYARLDDTDGHAIWAQTLNSPNFNIIAALAVGPVDSICYGLTFAGDLDVEPGPGVTTLSTGSPLGDPAVVKVFADNTF